MHFRTHTDGFVRDAEKNARAPGAPFTDQEGLRFADQPVRGHHLFRSGKVWVATAPGFRDTDGPEDRFGVGEGRTGRQDAINMLYARTRFQSPLSPAGFHEFDPR